MICQKLNPRKILEKCLWNTLVGIGFIFLVLKKKVEIRSRSIKILYLRKKYVYFSSFKIMFLSEFMKWIFFFLFKKTQILPDFACIIMHIALGLVGFW